MKNIRQNIGRHFQQRYRDFHDFAAKRDVMQVLTETLETFSKNFSQENMRRSLRELKLRHLFSGQTVRETFRTTMGATKHTFSDFRQDFRREIVDFIIVMTLASALLYPIYRVQKYRLRESARKKAAENPNENAP